MDRLPWDGRIPPVLSRARDLAHLCDLRSRAGRRHPSAGFPLAGPKTEPIDTSTRSRNSAVSPAQPSPADLTAPKPSLVQPRLQQRSPAHRSPPQFSTGHPSCSVALPTRAEISRRIPTSPKIAHRSQTHGIPAQLISAQPRASQSNRLDDAGKGEWVGEEFVVESLGSAGYRGVRLQTMGTPDGRSLGPL